MLARMLDTRLKEEDKQQPMQLPSIDIYRHPPPPSSFILSFIHSFIHSFLFSFFFSFIHFFYLFIFIHFSILSSLFFLRFTFSPSPPPHEPPPTTQVRRGGLGREHSIRGPEQRKLLGHSHHQRWSCCLLAVLYSCSPVLLPSCTLAVLYSCSPVLLPSCTLACCTVVACCTVFACCAVVACCTVVALLHVALLLRCCCTVVALLLCCCTLKFFYFSCFIITSYLTFHLQNECIRYYTNENHKEHMNESTRHQG